MSEPQFDAARERMLREQLQRRGIRSTSVLQAMARVPREEFVADDYRDQAYADGALPIACEQTISQPYIVALMSEALELSGQERVLEIGTGSGYQTAVLAELAATVYSVERHAELSQQAQTRLVARGYQNVHLRIGDGSLGWPEEAPFDRILITAVAEQCPAPLWQQLAEGGLLVAPFGNSAHQALYAQHKIGGQPQSQFLTQCRFVPLVSG
jgi:protein-L-isoaspartate(D-aspartate) O-methyltransferase